MKKEIWIDEASLKELYESGSVFAKLRTEIQSIPEVQLVEADLDMAAEIDRLHAINAELVEALKLMVQISRIKSSPSLTIAKEALEKAKQ